MNIIILAAGEEYIASKDNKYPLCLTELHGRSIIQHIADSLNFENNEILFIFQEKHIRKYHLSTIVELLSSGKGLVTSVPENTAGAATSALLGAVSLNQDEPLLIISSNQLTDIDYDCFTKNMLDMQYDAGTVIFEAIHPRYSFVSLDDDGLVNEASEKKPISKNATAGIYWFKSTALFVDSVKNMIRKDARVDSKFYICPSLNEVILAGGKVGVFRIDKDDYHPLKNVYQVEEFFNEAR
ncbi:glycosyltransferase family 2 protein [Dickeya oryzae]